MDRLWSFRWPTDAVKDATAVRVAPVIDLASDPILAVTSQAAIVARAAVRAITEARVARAIGWGPDPIRADIGLHARIRPLDNARISSLKAFRIFLHCRSSSTNPTTIMRAASRSSPHRPKAPLCHHKQTSLGGLRESAEIHKQTSLERPETNTLSVGEIRLTEKALKPKASLS
jgi:hypothetical protein